jgi:hypothetical protein
MVALAKGYDLVNFLRTDHGVNKPTTQFIHFFNLSQTIARISFLSYYVQSPIPSTGSET